LLEGATRFLLPEAREMPPTDRRDVEGEVWRPLAGWSRSAGGTVAKSSEPARLETSRQSAPAVAFEIILTHQSCLPASPFRKQRTAFSTLWEAENRLLPKMKSLTLFLYVGELSRAISSFSSGYLADISMS
jgi:hypothetical protein